MAPQATESAKIPSQPMAPVVQPAKTTWQPPAPPPADLNKTFSSAPASAETPNAFSSAPSPRFGNLLRDPQTDDNPSPSNFNLLRPQTKRTSAERWPIRASQASAVQAPMPGPVVSNYDAMTRSA